MDPRPKDRVRSRGWMPLSEPSHVLFVLRICRIGLAMSAGLFLVLGLGCYSGSAGAGPTPWSPFSLTASPDALNIPAGGGGHVMVTVSRKWGFADAITLSLEGAPEGVVASGIVPADAQTGTLTLRIERAVAPQTLDGIRVKGEAGRASQTAAFRLLVSPPLPIGQIGADLVQASGATQRGGSLENMPVIQESTRAISAKDATGQTELRHGFQPAARNN